LEHTVTRLREMCPPPQGSGTHTHSTRQSEEANEMTTQFCSSRGGWHPSHKAHIHRSLNQLSSINIDIRRERPKSTACESLVRAQCRSMREREMSSLVAHHRLHLTHHLPTVYTVFAVAIGQCPMRTEHTHNRC